jgi:hypothetical protein
MLTCVSCGANFAVEITVAGRIRNLRGRLHCLECRPYRPLKGPRRPVVRRPKSLICAACGREFLAKMVIDGNVRSLYRRKFCLECSPFGAHNTSKDVAVVSSDDPIRARRERRRAQYRRALTKRRRTRKRQLVEEFGGMCIECGYSRCLEALQFHHRDAATKAFSLGNFSGSLSVLRGEAEKCDLLCANCHRLRHVPAETDLLANVALRRKKKNMAVEHFGGICRGCGLLFLPSVFEFHHWNAAEKEFEIATRGMGRSWPALVAELSKCVMLCANCHCEVHFGELRLERGGQSSIATAV